MKFTIKKEETKVELVRIDLIRRMHVGKRWKGRDKSVES